MRPLIENLIGIRLSMLTSLSLRLYIVISCEFPWSYHEVLICLPHEGELADKRQKIP
jgi:hypothetical protein